MVTEAFNRRLQTGNSLAVNPQLILSSCLAEIQCDTRLGSVQGAPTLGSFSGRRIFPRRGHAILLPKCSRGLPRERLSPVASDNLSLIPYNKLTRNASRKSAGRRKKSNVQGP